MMSSARKRYDGRVPLSAADRVTLAGAMLAAPAWLRSRRNLYRPAAHPLREHEIAAFEPFFEPETLRDVRVAKVESFRRWPLEGAMRRVGFRGLLDSQSIAGIALIDTVVLITPAMQARHLSPLSLLFHELVHIEQYRLLRVRGFLRKYIGGWLEGDRSYLEIPLEQQAYELTERYEGDPGRAFSVAERVRAAFPTSGMDPSRAPAR
jgi:hypothetical protein